MYSWVVSSFLVCTLSCSVATVCCLVGVVLTSATTFFYSFSQPLMNFFQLGLSQNLCNSFPKMKGPKSSDHNPWLILKSSAWFFHIPQEHLLGSLVRLFFFFELFCLLFFFLCLLKWRAQFWYQLKCLMIYSLKDFNLVLPFPSEEWCFCQKLLGRLFVLLLWLGCNQRVPLRICCCINLIYFHVGCVDDRSKVTYLFLGYGLCLIECIQFIVDLLNLVELLFFLHGVC